MQPAARGRGGGQERGSFVAEHDHVRDDPERSFIAVARALADAAEAGAATIGDLVDRLDERAFGLLILFLTLPCLVPGLPGAQIIAIPIFILALQVLAGRREPWLPGWFLRARTNPGWLSAIAGFAEKRLRWTERMSRPRWRWLVTGLGERFLAFVMALAAITIMLPITNTIPSLALLFMSVALLQRDGLFAAIGMLIGLAWIGLLAALVGGLIFGAGFAVQFAAERAPWLIELFRPGG